MRKFLTHRRSVLVLALIVFAAGNAISNQVNLYHLEIIISLGINITLAVSLNLINGYTGQFSLGHAGFMAVGAYLSAALTLFLGPAFLQTFAFAGASVAQFLLFLTALLMAGLGAAAAGIIVGMPSLRLKGDYLAIVTLGFGEIIRVLFRNVESLGGATGLSGIPPYTNFFWTFAVAAVTVYVVTGMVHSTKGRGFIAVHDDEVAAEAMGINTTKFKIVAFVVGAFFAGTAGALYSHFKFFIDPRVFDFTRSIEIVVMVILGGMGNTFGVILAAIILTLLPEVLRPVAEYRMIIYSLLLIVLMLTRPQGLFSLHPLKKAFGRGKPSLAGR